LGAVKTPTLRVAPSILLRERARAVIRTRQLRSLCLAREGVWCERTVRRKTASQAKSVGGSIGMLELAHENAAHRERRERSP
jgi:hypothetical protein